MFALNKKSTLSLSFSRVPNSLSSKNLLKSATISIRTINKTMKVTSSMKLLHSQNRKRRYLFGQGSNPNNTKKSLSTINLKLKRKKRREINSGEKQLRMNNKIKEVESLLLKRRNQD